MQIILNNLIQLNIYNFKIKFKINLINKNL